VQVFETVGRGCRQSKTAVKRVRRSENLCLEPKIA
jgi:hypothetical protein